MLAVAPNGARKGKDDHPALPISPAELAHTAAACAEAGAAMIHLHVRDDSGDRSLDVERYRAATAAIRAACGQRMVIQMTTEAVGIYTPEQQMAMVRELKPEAVSLAVREIIPDAAHEPAAAQFLAWMRGERILPQYILYSADDVERFVDLQNRGVVPAGAPFLLFVLGRYSPGQRSQPEDLLPFLGVDRGELPWAVCAFGPKETACAVTAAALGGHARVGFENNMLLPDGSTAGDNADLVGAVRAGADCIGRRLADADEARALMAG